MDVLQPVIAVTTGGAALGIAGLLWALRISLSARRVTGKLRASLHAVQEKLARTEALLGAHPGVVLVWGESAPAQSGWGRPKIYGSPAALAGMLRFTDDSISLNPSERILEGLGDLEARDNKGQDSSLRIALGRLRSEGEPFSLTVIAPSGNFLEADGRAAGPRAVLWITDATVKGLEESGARGRLEEKRVVMARDPGAFLDMVKNSPVLVWRMTGSGKLQWGNDAYVRAVGCDSLERVLQGQTFLDRHILEQAESTLAAASEISRVRNIVIGTQRRALRVTMFPVSGGLAGMAIDVTEEEALREQLDRHVKSHDETLDRVADAVAIFDAERRLVFHNKAFNDMWRLDPSFLREKPNHGIVLDRLREARKLPAHSNYAVWRAEELAHYHHMQDEIADELWPLPDERTICVARKVNPAGGLLILFKDMTSQLILQAQYTSLLKVQEAVMNNLQPVAVFGCDGRLRLCNRSFDTLWGLDDLDLGEEPDFEAIASACKPLFHDKSVWAAIKGRITNPTPSARQKFDGEMARSDGKIVSFFTQPLPDGATLIAFKDESDARRNEELLTERAEAFEAADNLKTEFVKNISYQLRSPLTTIYGYAQMLDQLGNMPDKQKSQVGSILEAAGQLSDLIANILDLAMIETGRLELNIMNIDILEAIGESISMAVANAADTQVSIDVKCAPDIGTFQADGTRIRQMLLNLLTNALCHTDVGGTISVEAEKSDGVVCIKVTDTGCGIPPEKQIKVFDAFTSGGNREAGLGLALVKSFVQLHGGWVAMTSEPKKGTSVLCFFPEEFATQQHSLRIASGQTIAA